MGIKCLIVRVYAFTGTCLEQVEAGVVGGVAVAVVLKAAARVAAWILK